MAKEAEDRQEKPMAQDDPNLLVAQFQSYQQQLQSLLIQKESLRLQSAEVDKALEELGKTQQKSAYKITGQIMVSKPVEDLKKDMEDMKESIGLREKTLQKTEERIGNKMREIQEKLREMMK
jgi:prefoldin beta subunit